MKAENEKIGLEKIRKELQSENKNFAKEVLDQLQQIKKLQSDLQVLSKDKKLFDKSKEEIINLKDQLYTAEKKVEQKDKRIESLSQDKANLLS